MIDHVCWSFNIKSKRKVNDKVVEIKKQCWECKKETITYEEVKNERQNIRKDRQN